jgi:putative tributyrin esterase
MSFSDGQRAFRGLGCETIESRTAKLLFACLFVLFSAWPHPTLGQDKAAAASRAPLDQDESFRSDSLGRDGHYRILLPIDYSRGGRFPVLYLLHGLYGDDRNWETRTGLKNYARNLPLLIVMPDADDSWYTNSATVPQDKFEDFIAKDLIAEIDGKYRTIRERRGRAIAGLSMGGYGAVKMALEYPNLFAFAGSLSGALNAAENLDTLRPEFRAKLLEVFGNDGSPTRAENDVFLLLKKTSDQTALPYLYLACGTSDSFLDTNRAFVLQLSSRKIAYEYHETPGGHTWEYWDSALQPMLQAIQRTVTGFAPSP